ncbi:Cytochrome C1 heme lyase [Rhodotorula toruloides ATCC 204091]|uniref:Holocytochrome c-type synthase n=1 Tax=Rhodotorula toruloides TaxID=5286 RepID=A0A0K3CJF0_RHOTO|nr:Cytochrome C1 heme lyase [Rhodotorula toruloides ATCC 204091]KAK4330169.1 Holocytochrome-c1 synthase [Rhodotorula toruloides]PRQ71715.1 cytochrome C1 heme lyase [Rhodotorula toruloides]
MVWPFTSTATAPEQPAEQPSACPVDHTTRQSWLAANPSASSSSPAAPHSFPASDPRAKHLSTEREVSTIPRWFPSSSSSSASTPSEPSTSAVKDAHSSSDIPPPACPMHEQNVNSAEAAATVPSEENWVYPSPASFYTALQRKERNPRAEDMDVVVPIHNAVNERVWQQILDWERKAMGLNEGEETGSRLVSFVGKPKEMSPRARWKSLIGYTAPFDRHDWIVDRPLQPPAFTSSSSASPSPSSAVTPTSPADSTPSSLRIRYVIDFYTGRSPSAPLILPPSPSNSDKGPEEVFRPNLAFFIDARPALDGWEGVRMRFNRFWGLDTGEAAQGAQAKVAGK